MPILKSPPSTLIVTEPDGRIRSVNPAALQLLGYAEGELVGRNLDCVLSKSTDEAAQALEELGQSDAISNVAVAYTAKNGNIIPMALSASVLRKDGAVTELIYVAEDITRRKQAEAEAAQQRARFQFIFDSVPVGITWMELDNPASRMVNAAQARITGVPAEKSHQLELYGQATHPEDRKTQDEMHQRLLAGEIDHYTLEKRYLHPDGSTRWTELTVRFFRNAASGKIEEISTLVDITDHKRMEAALVQTSNMMETLLTHAPDFIYFKDIESRFVCYSQALAKHFQLDDLDALKGKSDFDCYTADVARSFYENEQDIIRTGQPLIGKLDKCVHTGGRLAWGLATKMPWRDRNGAIIGTFGISKDITALKEAEAKLEAAHQNMVVISRQAGMAEVATSVLHNVGNVLNSVNVSASLVADKVRQSKLANLAKVNRLLREHEADFAAFLANDPQGRQIPAYLHTLAEHLAGEQGDMLNELESLRKNIEHIKDIVAMQQNYSKVSGIAETLPVVDLVEDALRMNAGAFVRHDVALVRDYQAQPVVTLEKHKVLQILVNLMRNAKYACDDSNRKDKQMKIRVSNGSGRVKIAIIDNGVGIPGENLQRIFAHGFTTRKDGHGFGLHSGALAAKELGGSLLAYSDGPGQGATFVLELPAPAAPLAL